MAHGLPEQRDRRLVTWAGVAPDLDGLTLLAGIEAYGQWHHVLSHGMLTAVLVAVFLTFLARDRLKVMLLSFTTFHLHLVCDLLGSGVQWPIQYFWPFSHTFYYTPYGWELDSWHNITITILAIGVAIRLAVVSGRSFGEAFLPAGMDEAVVETLRRRFLGDEKKTVS